MRFQTINPFTGQWVREFENASDAEVEAALAGAAAAFQQWRFAPLEKRASVIKALAERVRARATELAALTTLEVGKLAAEAAWEVDMCAQVFDYAAEQGPKTLEIASISDAPAR